MTYGRDEERRSTLLIFDHKQTRSQLRIFDHTKAGVFENQYNPTLCDNLKEMRRKICDIENGNPSDVAEVWSSFTEAMRVASPDDNGRLLTEVACYISFFSGVFKRSRRITRSVTTQMNTEMDTIECHLTIKAPDSKDPSLAKLQQIIEGDQLDNTDILALLIGLASGWNNSGAALREEDFVLALRFCYFVRGYLRSTKKERAAVKEFEVSLISTLSVNTGIRVRRISQNGES